MTSQQYQVFSPTIALMCVYLPAYRNALINGAWPYVVGTRTNQPGIMRGLVRRGERTVMLALCGLDVLFARKSDADRTMIGWSGAGPYPRLAGCPTVAGRVPPPHQQLRARRVRARLLTRSGNERNSRFVAEYMV